MYTLPYIEQEGAFKLYRNLGGNDNTGPRYSGNPNNVNVTTKRFPVLDCPSDAQNAPLSSITNHNMVVNYGNTSFFQTTLNGVPFLGAPFHCYPPGWITPSARQSAMASQYGQNHPDHDRWGRFTDLGQAGKPVSLNQIVSGGDGTSNTILLSETIQGQGNDLRGFIWWGGASGFTTWSPPNANEPDVLMGGICNVPLTGAPCTTISTPTRPRMAAARSRHTGGVNVAFCDHHVGFVKDSIHIRVWRDLSTTRGGEVINQADL
jgi:prepilin-type processing-associated H-X9-DG protein